MSDTLTDDFEASLAGVDVSVTRTTAGGFEDAIQDAVGDAGPAVAVELPFDDVSLSETAVRVDPTPEALRQAQTGITPGELGITTYGSVVLRCTGDGAEFLALYPDRHVIVLTASDVLEDMPDGVDSVARRIRDESADFIIATGPSATADMGSVVQGVHGPSDVHVILLEDR